MNAVSIDVDMMEQMPAKTVLKLVEQTQNVQKFAKQWHLTITAFAPLFRRFEELDIDVRFSLADGDIGISFTGDGERLTTVWAELRRNGYVPTNRPEKGASTHNCWWKREGFSQFWMSFSSSVCRRVQVGTRMVEQPIYETVCSDLPEIEAPQQAVAVVGDDIPF